MVPVLDYFLFNRYLVSSNLSIKSIKPKILKILLILTLKIIFKLTEKTKLFEQFK